jgi:N-acetylglucosaminyldiphosphoundecaprenol N-acetyl-beta-D-mannosaminyltransferase
MHHLDRVELLGVPLDNLTLQESVDCIDQRIQANDFLQHVVVNVAKLVNARVDRELLDSIKSSDLINIDGMGVVYGAKLLGIDIKERVAGIDLFASLLDLSSKNAYRVFFLGATDEVLSKAIITIKAKYPNLIIAGSHHGYFWDDEKSVVDSIKQSNAQLLFVAISSPKKEIFINRWKHELGVNFAMGVGGTFDIYAGMTRRAPIWMQRTGLEWFYRTMQEPQRMWWRYFRTNSIFLVLLVGENLKKTVNRFRHPHY